MPQKNESKPIVKKRLLYIDNLRFSLIVLVILHHISVSYGGSGDVGIKEVATDAISPILFTIFNAINQSYFMNLFFLLSGFFLFSSLIKKGDIKFTKDRLIRLGIPLIFYTIIIAPLISYFVINFAREDSVGFIEIMTLWFRAPYWDVGPLWFVETLLIFSGIYLLVRMFSKNDIVLFKDKFPSSLSILFMILLLGALTFLVRTYYPIGEYFHVFQIAYFPTYVFSFYIGITAYKMNWFTNLPIKQAKFWKIIAIIIILVLPTVMGIGLAMGQSTDITAYLGGFTGQSLFLSFWETIAFFSIVISLLFIFQKKFDKQGPIAKWAAPNFYGAYILHMLVITIIMVPLLSIVIPSALKALIVALIAVPESFILSHIIRNIPGVKRVI